MLAHDRLDALVAPTTLRRGRSTSPRVTASAAIASSIAAVAGTPHLTVTMGAVGGSPVALSFMSPARSEARLLGFGYALEQAAKVHDHPRLPSLETKAAVGTLLAALKK